MPRTFYSFPKTPSLPFMWSNFLLKMLLYPGVWIFIRLDDFCGIVCRIKKGFENPVGLSVNPHVSSHLQANFLANER